MNRPTPAADVIQQDPKRYILLPTEKEQMLINSARRLLNLSDTFRPEDAYRALDHEFNCTFSQVEKAVSSLGISLHPDKYDSLGIRPGLIENIG